MKLEFLIPIKDTVAGAPTSFEKGDICTVDDKDAARFVAHGWAKEPGTEAAKDIAAPAEPTDLDVHKGVLGTKSKTL